MKICFFVGDISQKGGTERVAIIIANELAISGHEVYIMSLKNSLVSGFELNKNIKVISLKKGSKDNKKNFLSVVREIRSVLKKYKFDVLIEVEVMLRIFTVMAKIGLKMSIVSWEHFNFNVNLGTKLRDIARKIASKYSDYIITLTETDKKNYLKNLNCKAKVKAIENPLVFYPNEFSNVQSKTVVAVGRLTYQKGFDMLIDSWKIVNQKHPDWVLRLAGEGEMRKVIEDKILNAKLQGSVVLLGNINNVEEEYKNASIYVMSSRFEGFPMVLLEAMSFGLPVVSFDCETGPRDMINNNDDGILIEQDNIQKFAEGICKLIEDDNMRMNMSVNARKNIKRFSKENILRRWNLVLNDLQCKK